MSRPWFEESAAFIPAPSGRRQLLSFQCGAVVISSQECFFNIRLSTSDGTGFNRRGFWKLSQAATHRATLNHNETYGRSESFAQRRFFVLPQLHSLWKNC
jgi:hypothetical protein